ncbi:hypothetical protein RA20_14295 [Leisingera sp. ANG-Vp]|nr:hypothetical protein RA20_14295 [Leisingera sp. ANG-Vp]
MVIDMALLVKERGRTAVVYENFGIFIWREDSGRRCCLNNDFSIYSLSVELFLDLHGKLSYQASVLCSRHLATAPELISKFKGRDGHTVCIRVLKCRFDISDDVVNVVRVQLASRAVGAVLQSGKSVCCEPHLSWYPQRHVSINFSCRNKEIIQRSQHQIWVNLRHG